MLDLIPSDLQPEIDWYCNRGLTNSNVLRTTKYKVLNEFGPYKSLYYMTALAVDESGNFYVAWRNQIFMFDGDDGKGLRTWTTGLHEPHTILFDSDKNLILSNFVEVLVFDLGGSGRRFSFGDTRSNLPCSITGLTRDQVGDFALARTHFQNYRHSWSVQIFNPKGICLRQFNLGTETHADLPCPGVFIVDIHGNYLVCEANNTRVSVFSPVGDLLRFIEGQDMGSFACPRGMVMDQNGCLIIANAGSKILVLSQEGKTLMKFGGPAKKDGELGIVLFFALDKTGRIIVADRRQGPSGYRRIINITTYG